MKYEEYNQFFKFFLVSVQYLVSLTKHQTYKQILNSSVQTAKPKQILFHVGLCYKCKDDVLYLDNFESTLLLYWMTVRYRSFIIFEFQFFHASKNYTKFLYHNCKACIL